MAAGQDGASRPMGRREAERAERAFRDALRREARPRGWRLTRYSVWREDGPFFLHATVLLEGLRPPTARVSLGAKTLALDDLLWDVLGMQGNSGAYHSLRAVGAFTASGLPLLADARRSAEGEGEEALGALAGEVMGECDRLSRDLLGSVGRDEAELYRRIVDAAGPADRHGADGLAACLSLILLGDVAGAARRAAAREEAVRGEAAGGHRPSYAFGVGAEGDATLVRRWCERRLAGEGGAGGAGGD